LISAAVEEMMQERGVLVDHVTVHRWTLKVLYPLRKNFAAALCQ
jgi:transposase-like protein